jgi:hypothetical protein
MNKSIINNPEIEDSDDDENLAIEGQSQTPLGDYCIMSSVGGGNI